MKLNTIAIMLLSLALLPLRLQAQEEIAFEKGGCTPDINEESVQAENHASPSRRKLQEANLQWDANKTYKQLVILFSYSDMDFMEEHTREFYDKIFNEPGYNSMKGAGCVADYFREQSNGLFNVQFDVFGPYQVDYEARIYAADASTKNYSVNAMKAAVNKLKAEYPNWDYTQYDWNGDNKVEQVIFIAAGYSGNQDSKSYGYIWPNTSSFNNIQMPGGVIISDYTASAERWMDDSSAGIGTICHEYSHSLGLPDIYPTDGTSQAYSICDEWDLMDGGNFTNYGWCPPNYTAQEKLYLNWLNPIELTEPTAITGMKPVSEGGDIYIIKHTDNEYYLLENRQWSGWDLGLPGKGLLITHVDFNANVWTRNKVNNEDGHPRFDIVHADNLDYTQWNTIQPRTTAQWAAKDDRMHNKHLSTSSYPWVDEAKSIVNRALTDTSTPAATMYNANVQGLKLLGKSITNIQMADDGTISFNFMMDEVDAVEDILTDGDTIVGWCALNGQQLNAQPVQSGVYIAIYKDGTKRKVFLR